jgi:hypothetical protein
VGDPDTSDSCGDDDYIVHEQDLGAIEYRKGDTTLAYQGGGVWRLGSGDARMVSPPEFHYRAATLTFPVVTVTGDGSGAGGTTASIRAKQKGVTQYPASCNTADCGYPDTDDDGDGYPAASDGDDDGGQFTNPVQNGYVKIQVTSEYAAGWEEYFRTRTEGKVSRSGDTVEVRLISVGGVGDFQMPPEGTPLPIRGISQTSEHPVNEFTITLSDNTGSGQKDFANAHWSFYAGVGQTDKFEMHLYSKGKCQGDSWDGKDVYLSIFYKNESTDTREEWVLDGVDPASSSAIDVDCSGSDDTMTVDWMDSGTQLEYMDIEDSQGNMLGGNNNNKFQFREEAAEPISPSSETLNNHDTATDPGNVDEGDTESLAFLTNHYIGMMPSNYDFKIRNGPSNQDAIDADNSFGTFDYDLATNPKYVTYLHVSENEVEVSFD